MMEILVRVRIWRLLEDKKMKKAYKISPLENESAQAFRMIDVGRKRATRRRAIAFGKIQVGAHALRLIVEKLLPKGDVLSLAEVAGIMGAKKTPDLLPLCHTLPLDQVSIHCVPQFPDTIEVYCQVGAYAKTGVEMEALAGVQAALLTIWDLVKGTEPALVISDIKLLVKEGGKSGLWINPQGIPEWLADQLPRQNSLSDVKTAVLVMSDRAAKGIYEDRSGTDLVLYLCDEGAENVDYRVIPDEEGTISDALHDIKKKHDPDIIITSGGTGPGPRDVTPDVLDMVCDRILEGFGEMLRHESAAYTDTAWLSRMRAGMLGDTLVIALPGSPKAVAECWEILKPFIGHALKMIAGQGHCKIEGEKK
jgi:cyclic pyranopterin monophosphate synthase